MEVIGSIYTEVSDDFQKGIIGGGISRCVKAEKHDLGVVLMERKLGNIFGFQGGNYAGNVYDKDFECPTLNTMQGGCKQPMIVENPKELGFMDNGTGKHQSNTVYDENALCPNITTIQGGGTQQIKILSANSIRMVRTEQGKALRKQYENHEIHHGFNEHREPELRKDGVTNTLSTVQKDNYICVAMRGRNPTNPSDRTPGIETEQRLEPNTHGTCNTLTSVQKDNLVLEKNIPCKLNKMPDGHLDSMENAEVCDINTPTSSTVTARYHKGIGAHKDNMVMDKIAIKQATKQGYIECELGGVADLSYPNSNTRRGRVQDDGNTCPTLTAENQDICRIEQVGQISSDNSQYGTVLSENGLCSTLQAGTHGYANNCIQTQYRIRKLTPRECWRLMDFADEDFEKAAEVNSNTQLYKQAGNSIVKNVLVAILGQMIPGKENVYKELSE